VRENRGKGKKGRLDKDKEAQLFFHPCAPAAPSRCLIAAMVSRKRAHSEMETPPEQRPQEPDLLKRLRDCWELANLMQYIFTFGKVMKIDEDFDIEVGLYHVLGSYILVMPNLTGCSMLCRILRQNV
jgi:DNA-directed RNA polymerase